MDRADSNLDLRLVLGETDKTILESLSNSLEISQAEVLKRAIRLLARETLFNQMREDYEAIHSDKVIFEQLNEENLLLDAVSGDGI